MKPPRITHEVRKSGLVGVTNGLVEILFDARTGALRSLRNCQSGDEYLKEPLAEGNPFRAYVDTTSLPAPLTDPGWWSGRIEGNMGGVVVDGAQCSLASASFTRSGGGGILKLTTTTQTPALSFEIVVTLRDRDDAADWTMTVRNDAQEPHTVMTAFPHLTGLGLGASRESNRGLMLASYGTPGLPAWVDGGGLYGREVSMQWQAIYDPPSNEGLGIIVRDPELLPKLIRRFAPSGMSVLYLPAITIQPGQGHRYPATTVMIHQGDWRVVARRYGEWFRKTFRLHQPPGWLRDIDLYLGDWIPNGEDVAKAKEEESRWRAERSASSVGSVHLRPPVFTSFERLPLVYVSGQYDLKEWAMYNQGVISDPSTYGPYMADGTYCLRSDLGEVPAMQEGVKRAHQIGRRVMFYVAGYSLLKDSEILRGNRVEDYLLMNLPGQMWDIGYPNGITICPGYEPWQDHLAQTCKRLLWETGADGIRLDELGTFVPCYNPAHHHRSPFDSLQWLRQLLRKVRAAMDEVNPDAILCTENPVDIFHESCDASLQMFQPGRDIDAMRVAIPSYVGFAYHPGAVESGLNGWIGGKVAARRVTWPWEHRGLAGKPSYYQAGPGPDLRWHELRASFREAIVDCEVALRDPMALDDPMWVGRLWRAKDYWLMVGGHEDGTPLDGPTTIRLPALPEPVHTAYEIDAATLRIQDAHLVRNKDGIYVTVGSGFSAVLLPTPTCPPLLTLRPDPIAVVGDKPTDVALKAFGPWGTEPVIVEAHARIPGMEVSPSNFRLPTTLRIRTKADTEPGYYPLVVSGNCLTVKRWVRVTF